MVDVFVGRYDGNVAADGTITIPMEWAGMLHGGPWVGMCIHPSDECLVIGTDENESRLTCVAIDKSGRITVPMELREQAHIRNKVVMVGCVRCICIWAYERYERGESRFDASDLSSPNGQSSPFLI